LPYTGFGPAYSAWVSRTTPLSDIAETPANAIPIPIAFPREMVSFSSQTEPSATNSTCVWTRIAAAATEVHARLSIHAAKWTASRTPDAVVTSRSRRESVRSAPLSPDSVNGRSTSVVNSNR